MQKNAIAVLNCFPREVVKIKHILVEIEEFNPDTPWAYFDGAAQKSKTGAGGVHLHNKYKLSFKAGTGEGINNFVELWALKILLSRALLLGITHLQVFMDAKIVIEWVNDKIRCRNIFLAPLLEEIRRLKRTMEATSFAHIYRERNSEVDLLSKAGMELKVGDLQVSKEKDGEDT